jgi:hypothetical protein
MGDQLYTHSSHALFPAIAGGVLMHKMLIDAYTS